MKQAPKSTMVLRTSFVVSILAGLAVGGLNLTLLNQKITHLQVSLTAQTVERQKAETDLANARSDLATSSAALERTRTILETANLETQRAVAAEAAQLKRAEKLSGDLAATRMRLEDAQANLARYEAAGMEPDKIAGAARQIRYLQNTLAAVEKQNQLQAAKINMLVSLHPEDGTTVLLPPDLKAKVVASDPKWHFIVLDAGEDEGVLENGELLVSRQGKLLAKAKVSRVQKNRSVANLLPGWAFADVSEGDLVFPASPHS
jgi:hypothetical protein